jgi:hypothetical protein
MKAFFNTVKYFLSLGTGRTEDVVATALSTPVAPITKPGFVTELMGDPTKALAETFPGLKVVAVGGIIDGDEPVVMARIWTSPEGGFKKGNQLFASSDEGKAFAWFSTSPTLEGEGGKKGNDPGAFFVGLDPETGETNSDVLFPEIRTKFKLAAHTRDASTFEAIVAIEEWMLHGDGSRRDLLVIAQLRGEAKAETDKKTKAGSGSDLQMVSGLIICELPSMRRKGTLGALRTSPSPVTVRKGSKPTPKPTAPTTMVEALAEAEAEAKAGGPQLRAFAQRMLADGDDL